MVMSMLLQPCIACASFVVLRKLFISIQALKFIVQSHRKELVLKRNDSPEMDLIYQECKKTCELAFIMLGDLLQRAKPSPELVKFMSNNDIHSAIQGEFSDHYVQLDMDILAFLSVSHHYPSSIQQPDIL